MAAQALCMTPSYLNGTKQQVEAFILLSDSMHVLFPKINNDKVNVETSTGCITGRTNLNVFFFLIS